MSDLKETGELKDIKPNKAQLDMEKIQASMQGPERFFPPLSNEVKSRIYEIQSMPIEERRQAVADFHKTKAGQQAGELNGGVMSGGKGVYFRDADGNQYDILYQEDK